MTGVENIINEHLVTLDLKANSREGAIMELAMMLFRENKLISLFGFIDAVTGRENTLSTYCGSEVAIPHAQSIFVKEAGIAFGRTTGFSWEEEDETVSFIFLLALPEADDSFDAVHMGVISSIAELALEKDIRDKWAVAKTKEDILETFKEAFVTKTNL